jgi:hypothetical protein
VIRTSRPSGSSATADSLISWSLLTTESSSQLCPLSVERKMAFCSGVPTAGDP